MLNQSIWKYSIDIYEFDYNRYKSGLENLVYKEDYLIEPIPGIITTNFDTLLWYAESLYFKNEEDLLMFKLKSNI